MTETDSISIKLVVVGDGAVVYYHKFIFNVILIFREKLVYYLGI